MYLKEHDYRIGETEEAQGMLQQLPLRDFNFHAGYFLLDRNAFVHWMRIETPAGALSGWGRFPAAEELLAAARAPLGLRRANRANG